MHADQETFGRRRPHVACRRRPRRHDQALEPAPARAHLEVLEVIEELPGDRAAGVGEQDTEQARGAFEVAFPDRVAGVGRQRRIKNSLHEWLFAEPLDELEGVALMTFQADIERTDAAVYE